MCRARSACGGPLPAPAEQDQSDETGDKERESGWERDGGSDGALRTSHSKDLPHKEQRCQALQMPAK